LENLFLELYSAFFPKMNLNQKSKEIHCKEPTIQDLDTFPIIQTLIHVGPSNGLDVAKA
jgi:hypothetical protein